MQETKYTQEQFEAQLALEAGEKAQAEALLRASLDKAQAEGTASHTSIGTRLIKQAFEDCRANVQAFITECAKPKKGATTKYRVPMKALLDIYAGQEKELEYLLTFSTLSVCLNLVFTSDRPQLTAVSRHLMEDIEREANVTYFIKCQSDKYGKDMQKSIEAGIAQRKSDHYRASYVVNRMAKEGHLPIKWASDEKHALSAKLIELIALGSGYFEIVAEVIDTKGKTLNMVRPSEWLVRVWQKNADLLEAYAHRLPACIIPPKPWTDPFDGGYYGALAGFQSLIRVHYQQSNSFLKDYRRRLGMLDLSRVYKAVNALQDTAWTINTDILQVAQTILDNGGNLGGIASTEPLPNLPPLTGDYTEAELKAHKKKQADIYKADAPRQTKALKAIMEVATAKKYSKYDRIYFPWNMDFRGRLYPIPTTINPQGDDLGKALIKFADPKPSASPRDYKWLAIHGANLAGVDKVSFEERIKWVEDNTDNIIRSAEAPLEYRWWNEVAQGDYPMQFLSFCYEWKAMQDYISIHGNCIGYKCAIPIAWDGSCSGLQHYAGLLRDEIGGKEVNLLPMDSVQDVYATVAKKVNERIFYDAVHGTTTQTTEEGKVKKGTRESAQAWLTYMQEEHGAQGVTRKITKRSVMTLAYGSGQFGFKENLVEDFIKDYNLRVGKDNSVFDRPEQDCMYLATLIWDALSTTVVKAVEGMKFLKDLAHLITKEHAVVTWSTPMGFLVQQNYMQYVVERYQARISNRRYNIFYELDTGNINTRKQAQGIAPNYIHSMDASHLQAVVNASLDEGNTNFAMVHDSFGTDLAHAGRMYEIVREQFVKLYEGKDHLNAFLEEVDYLIEDKTKLPIRPDFGNLDIRKVLESKYCFA